MRNEEAIKELKHLSGTLTNATVYPSLDNINLYYIKLSFHTIIFDVLDHAIKALENQERYRWHDLRKNPDDLPIPEKEVDVVCERKYAGKSIFVYTHGLYEDGTIRENDSEWSWIDIDGEYDEEEDCYIVPKGWWEYKHYSHYDEYNDFIDDDVIAWKEIEPFEEVASDDTY